nr:uncharacterized protein LOC113822662 [Penaeus vannamei]
MLWVPADTSGRGPTAAKRRGDRSSWRVPDLRPPGPPVKAGAGVRERGGPAPSRGGKSVTPSVVRAAARCSVGSARSLSLRPWFSAPIDSHTCWTPWSVFQDGSGGVPTLCTPRGPAQGPSGEGEAREARRPPERRRLGSTAASDPTPDLGRPRRRDRRGARRGHRGIPGRARWKTTNPARRVEQGRAERAAGSYQDPGLRRPSSQRVAATYCGGKIARRRRAGGGGAPHSRLLRHEASGTGSRNTPATVSRQADELNPPSSIFESPPV